MIKASEAMQTITDVLRGSKKGTFKLTLTVGIWFASLTLGLGNTTTYLGKGNEVLEAIEDLFNKADLEY